MWNKHPANQYRNGKRDYAKTSQASFETRAALSAPNWPPPTNRTKVILVTKYPGNKRKIDYGSDIRVLEGMEALLDRKSTWEALLRRKRGSKANRELVNAGPKAALAQVLKEIDEFKGTDEDDRLRAENKRRTESLNEKSSGSFSFGYPSKIEK
jgi:hypothetical protein